MSTEDESMEGNKDEDDYNDESPSPKNPMTPQDSPAKSDVHAWRKRNSYAFQRNPLLVRRMSRGEQLGRTRRGFNRSARGVEFLFG